MKLLVKIIAALVLLVNSNPILAQVLSNRVEKAGDRKELLISSKQLKRDEAELEAFRQKTHAFISAWLADNEIQAKELKLSLIKDMDREIRQSQRKTFSDKNEVRKSSKEIQNSERDLEQSSQDRNSRNEFRLGDVLAHRDDRRDHRDDVRDYEDDQLDFASQAYRTKVQQEIRDKFSDWVFREIQSEDVEATAEVRQLNMFISSMEHDLISTRSEISEDRKELREDRRELREDRREQREDRRVRRESRRERENLN